LEIRLSIIEMTQKTVSYSVKVLIFNNIVKTIIDFHNFQIIMPTRATTRVAPTNRSVGATLAHALTIIFMNIYSYLQIERIADKV
jgi:hypothetical protein